MNFDNLTDINDEFDALDELEDLFDNISIDTPTREQINLMYEIFLNDIVRKPIMIKGVPLTSNRNKSNHPICRGKSQGFEHIITRENKHSGKRHFDKERANKIHWIKPIIENITNFKIKYYEQVNDKGKNQLFYWFKEKSFIVIVREINEDLMLITSYSVDAGNENQFKEGYEKFRK